MNILPHFSWTTLALTASAFMVAVFSLISAYRKDSTPPWVHWCAFGAAILAAIAGFGAALEAGRDAATIQSTTLRIAELSEKNAALITGGEHFCYFDPVETSPDEFTWNLVRMGRGTAGPIYDISCSIIDVNALRTQPQPGTPSAPNKDALAAATKSIHLGTLNPGEYRIFRKVSLAGLDSQAYVVTFSARNGSWKQAICFERVNGKWTRAIRFTPTHETAGFISHEPWITGPFPTNAVP